MTTTLATPKTDAELTAAVRNVLRWDVEIPEERVDVLVRDGCVTLRGTVDYWYERAAAADAVRRLNGVVAVRDEICLEWLDVGDAAIAADVNAALARRSAAEGIRVHVQERIVTLRGLVLTYVERVEAERAAWSARGVRDVHNKIVATR